MKTEMRMELQMRRQQEINTDPQRRCYNGCHFSSELVWMSWETLMFDVKPDKVDEVLAFWKDLNNYAVSQRGESARCEYRLVELEQ